MKKLYTYRFVEIFNIPGAGHMKYRLELDRGERVNVESEQRKLAKLNKGKRKSEKIKALPPDRILVGLNKLIRMHSEGRIVGNLPTIVRSRLGLDRPKERSDKGKLRKPRRYLSAWKTPKIERDLSAWGNNKVEPMPAPTMYGPVDYFEVERLWYSLPDIFEVF